MEHVHDLSYHDFLNNLNWVNYTDGLRYRFKIDNTCAGCVQILCNHR